MSTLFAFPTTGSAFTKIQSKNVDNDLGLPPPRKAPRHDSSSSPNKRTHSISGATSRTIPIALESPVTPIQRTIPALTNLVEQFIRTFLRTGNEFSSFTASYQDVFNACKILVLEANQASSLASIVERTLKACAVEMMKELLNLGNIPVMQWLERFNRHWHWWCRRLDVLRATLLYLDSVFLIPHEERLPIRDHGLQIFTDTILQSPDIHQKLDNVIRQWSSEKHGAKFTLSNKQRMEVETFVECATTLDRYTEYIEQPYLVYTSDYYTQKSQTASSFHKPLEYLKICVDDVAKEESGGMEILREETVNAAAVVALQKLVTPHVEMLTGDALSAIVSAKDKSMLVQLHRLIQRVTSSITSWVASPTDSLLVHYKNDIFERVKEIVVDTSEGADKAMVDRLLDLKEFLDECMGPDYLDDTDKKYIYATSEAFERGFACRKVKPAELIAKYVDQLMRHGQKAASDAEFFAEMKRVLTLYRYSPDKDVFRTFYTRALAKRMLLGRSASDDFEKEVLKVLSESYDAAFGDLTQMFSDLAVSKDLVEEYRKVKRGQPDRPDAALSVMVLQHSVWPVIRKVIKTDAGVEIVLPSKMEAALADYDTFYRERHANRQLSWAHYLGTATLTARFPSGKKELSVSLYQATVLLLFSERDTWTFEEISSRLLLNTNELNLTIQSLALGRKLVLRRTTPRAGKDVKLEDSFSFNAGFTDTKVKLHINSIQQNDTVEETVQAVKVIDQYRDASLDAAIVRIMKGAKTMKNQQLVNETIEAVAKHFKPEVKTIKTRIDSLIEREFIKRKDGTADTFVYLA